MSWLSKAIGTSTKTVDKMFGTGLARKYRQIDPIARLFGEEHQRHAFHTLFTGGPGPAGALTDYFSGRNRGQSDREAWRHTYQSAVRSAGVLALIFGGSYLAAGAPEAEGAAVGTGAATGEASAAGGTLGSTTLGSGGGSTSLVSGWSSGVGQVGTAGEVNAAAAGAGIGPTTTFAPVKEAATGGFLTELGKNAIAPAIIVGGQALAAQNTPSAGEEEEDVLAARQKKNRLGPMQVRGGRPASFSRTRPLTPQEMLTAGGYSQQFDPKDPTGGLLTRANYAGIAGVRPTGG